MTYGYLELQIRTFSIFMNLKKKIGWWEQLEEQWKKAFNEAYLNKGPVTAPPSSEELDLLLTAPVLRIVGPDGSHPNLSFQLTNCSGVAQLKEIGLLVLMSHEISKLDGVERLSKLKSAYLSNNKLKSLRGLEKCTSLEELYVNANELTDLNAIAKLPSLRVLNCAFNEIKAVPLPPQLKELYCLPNDHLPDSEVIRIEQKEGIRCRRG
jgi:hypothetical protein